MSKQGADEPRSCGIVMPISATTAHDAGHWESVQILLHRAVTAAGLQPKNVWTGSSSDRITPRIIANLFEVPIAICDISDLNPNVMLELGMRLTSKKPTVVVAEIGSKIPFDISDFETIFYPPDLNILGMERFFDDLASQVKEKLAAFDQGLYVPFIKDLDVEVLEPDRKEVSFETLVANRLDDIAERLSRVETIGLAPRPSASTGLPLSPVVGQPRGVLVELKGRETCEHVAKVIQSATMFQALQATDRSILLPFSTGVAPVTVEAIAKALRDAGIDAVVTAV